MARYRILSLLGAGGMGEVYLARDKSLGRSVALKILPPELVRNEERVRRFVQKAKAASSLSHPHIVTIHEIGEAEVRPEQGAADTALAAAGPATRVHFIAMELVSGSTLRDLIHKDRTDLRTLVRHLAAAARTGQPLGSPGGHGQRYSDSAASTEPLEPDVFARRQLPVLSVVGHRHQG